MFEGWIYRKWPLTSQEDSNRFPPRCLFHNLDKHHYIPMQSYTYLTFSSKSLFVLIYFCFFSLRHVSYNQRLRLGKEGSMDFLDSSPWPFSILDAFLNLNESQFLSYAQYAQQKPVTPRVPLTSLHWQAPVKLETCEIVGLDFLEDLLEDLVPTFGIWGKISRTSQPSSTCFTSHPGEDWDSKPDSSCCGWISCDLVIGTGGHVTSLPLRGASRSGLLRLGSQVVSDLGDVWPGHGSFGKTL